MIEDLNKDLINARVREANDVIRLLEGIADKDFEALTDHEKDTGK